ncbi:MAG TPA: carboxypeptidase regulatory-like domain-containing protein, partial [Casimicrobiaceae bacterium]
MFPELSWTPRPARRRPLYGHLCRLLSIAGVAVAMLFSGARVATAQDGAITGRVVSAGTNDPIANAQITVAGGTQRATSDPDGRFRLTGVTSGSVTIDVRRIGYRSAQVSARAGQTGVVITLTVNPAALEAIVVTGTAGAQEKREVANAVTTIDASSVVQAAPIPSMQSLLNGRSTGLVVMPTSGAVGTGSQVRIRGISSFSLG